MILTLADYDLQKKYSDEISRLRYLGSIDQSIDKCKEASLKFPDSNFFYKILGDLYSQKKDFGNASIAYIEQLKHLNERPDQFKAFARFYQMLEKKTPPDFIKQFRKEILGEIQREKIEPNVIKLIISFLGGEFLQDEGTIAFLKKTDDDRNFAEVKKYVNNLEDIESIQAMIKWRIEAKDRNNSHKTDDYFISVGEKLELYGLTLKLIEKIYSQNAKPNPIVIRTLLRICRKQDDYTFAERILNINSDFVLRSDFNIQYELVYFFEYKCNDELLEWTLNRMRTQSATSSIPIARTLYNFYLRLNRFEEAKEISEHIRELEVSRHTSSQISRAEEQLESEQGVWIKLQELISEQEHNRQMIAMRDLLKGFSHELGQPITNIRYSTQLYQMKTQRGLATEEDILTLLQLILNQTERVGKMLKRFSPIVSSESKTDKFNVFNKINGVFLDLTSRLNICNIKYNLQGDREAEMCGDSIQFEQVFYNLILNSMQAISESMDRGCITVKISVNHQGNLLIFFIDNGPGIAAEHIKKVFEPFYSTKNPTSGNGGEGLGLFVVWNILKIFNGSILLDKEYKKGAKFIITINSKEVNLE